MRKLSVGSAQEQAIRKAVDRYYEAVTASETDSYARGFDPPLQLIVGGIDVISNMRALQKLAKVDPNPLRHLDTVLFPKLGVMMGVERTPKDCQVAVFAEGALGDLLSEFDPAIRARSARWIYGGLLAGIIDLG